jgi:hypothetical protein
MSKQQDHRKLAGHDSEPLPRYVEELRNLCRRHAIPCRLDRAGRSAALTLPPDAQEYTPALTAVVADIRSHTTWTVAF